MEFDNKEGIPVSGIRCLKLCGVLQADGSIPLPTATSQPSVVPYDVPLEEGERITRIVDFQDLTEEDMPLFIGDLEEEVDSILKEMLEAYGPFLSSNRSSVDQGETSEARDVFTTGKWRPKIPVSFNLFLPV